MTSPAEDTATLIARASTRLALHINEPLVQFLVHARELCDGDLDMALVLLVIIQRANRHPEFQALAHAHITDGLVTQLPSLDVNLKSIADSTGIARETVRRKVEALRVKGWVQREGATVRYTHAGYVGVAPGRSALIRMAARIADAVDRICYGGSRAGGRVSS